MTDYIEELLPPQPEPEQALWLDEELLRLEAAADYQGQGAGGTAAMSPVRGGPEAGEWETAWPAGAVWQEAPQPEDRGLGADGAAAGEAADGTGGGAGLRRALSALHRAVGYGREHPEAAPAASTAFFSPPTRPEGQSGDTARAVDRVFQRDARRYDGGFALY